MTQYKKLYKKMKTLNIILVVLVAVCLALIIFLLTRIPDEQPRQGGTDQTTAPTAVSTTPTEPSSTAGKETDPQETNPQATVPPQEDPTMIWIDTPYVRLCYSAQWENYLMYEHTQRDGVFTESFYCRIAGEQIRLFDIHFGTVNEGELLGYLLKDGQNIPVCVTPYDFAPDDSWREEDTYVIFSMQEGINDVIQCIMAYENFSRG